MDILLFLDFLTFSFAGSIQLIENVWMISSGEKEVIESIGNLAFEIDYCKSLWILVNEHGLIYLFFLNSPSFKSRFLDQL